jgi:GT2 family glycosyltransferase
MRVLAHIHTLNDQEVIERAVEALQKQTRAPDAIVIVDNGSTDATLDRTFPENVTVIRNGVNLGTSGAIRVGFAFGIEHQFDWVWIFDADSVPEPDALERLLGFYEKLPAPQKGQVCFLFPHVAGEVNVVLEFTESSIRSPSSDGGTDYTRCDAALWSGSLYRMAAVQKIGLPSADYVLDSAELEYGYRASQLGFSSYMVHDSVLHHGVGRRAGVASRICQVGPLRLTLYDGSPIRCYYHVRNPIYFWLYQSKHRGVRQIVHSIINSCAFAATFAIRPISQRRQLIACLRGIWDGLTMHLERRY